MGFRAIQYCATCYCARQSSVLDVSIETDCTTPLSARRRFPHIDVRRLLGRTRDQHDVQFLPMHSQDRPRQTVEDAAPGLSSHEQISRSVSCLRPNPSYSCTQRSVAEIAYDLGYSDQFHLSKTFKRIIGIAPQDFRTQHQKVT